MIKWTKDGKVDRSGITNLYKLNHFNSIADALDEAVAALRECKRIGDDVELSWADSGNQIFGIIDCLLSRLGVEP